MSGQPEQTTEQTAITMMLSSIGEKPVNNIAASQRLDVMRAVATLNEINVLVQTRGWWFNEEVDVPHTPNAAGEYVLDPNIVKVDVSEKHVRNFKKRGLKLYNTTTRTTTGHTADLNLDYILLLPFDDLPESAKLYIARRAGVIFQTRSVGSPILFEFTEQQAQEAWGLLQTEELEHVDTNLTFAPGIRDAVYNR
jgi:hypothetical protein